MGSIEAKYPHKLFFFNFWNCLFSTEDGKTKLGKTRKIRFLLL
jgi:hypothetical protein